MANLTEASVARLLPRPGETVFNTGDRMPKTGMSQSSPSCRFAWPKPSHWDGFGHANLHDGLLWDIPVFGILSPVLNTVSPGLGNSRATEASVRFAITNGVIYSSSLDIRSTMMRLEYAGTADLQENVNARVTAQLLRNTWVVGPLVSTALWPVSKLFEYHVTGTLKNPKSEPVFYIPRFLLLPLHPIRSLEELFPSDDFFSSSPPEK